MCDFDGSNPSDAFKRNGAIAVACRRTAIAAGVALLATGFIVTHFSATNRYRSSMRSSNLVTESLSDEPPLGLSSLR